MRAGYGYVLIPLRVGGVLGSRDFFLLAQATGRKKMTGGGGGGGGVCVSMLISNGCIVL